MYYYGSANRLIKCHSDKSAEFKKKLPSYPGSEESNKSYTDSAELSYLSNKASAECLAAARLGRRQPASPTRLMLSRPHLDPFISCFQKDISLATKKQRLHCNRRRLCLRPRITQAERTCQGQSDLRQTGPPRILLWVL